MKNLILNIVLILVPVLAHSQNDSLVFRNENVLVGEIKSLERGVLQIETDYSDSDFKIEWLNIEYIHTETKFFITLSDESNYYGILKSVSGTETQLIMPDSQSVTCKTEDIVGLIQLKENVWDRLFASIDVGFSKTKANNLTQFTTRSTLGYQARRWSIESSFNSLFSDQDSLERIERSDAALSYRYVLPSKWYSIVSITGASNTEQKLDLRLNALFGLGRFFIRTNSSYWGVRLGVNRNIERYSNDSPDRNTWEGNLGTELNLYDIGDLNLLLSLLAYPGITEKGRLRSDFTFDMKYDLPYDFYIKIGTTINYDNRPAEGADEADYVLQTGFGWEW